MEENKSFVNMLDKVGLIEKEEFEKIEDTTSTAKIINRENEPILACNNEECSSDLSDSIIQRCEEHEIEIAYIECLDCGEVNEITYGNKEIDFHLNNLKLLKKLELYRKELYLFEIEIAKNKLMVERYKEIPLEERKEIIEPYLFTDEMKKKVKERLKDKYKLTLKEIYRLW